MRNRTFKKIGGSFKWLRSHDINNTLKSIKMDIDSRCNRKFLKLNKMCESRGYGPYLDISSSRLNPYSSIKDALVRESPTEKCFYYISPNKRKFIFKINHSQIDQQYQNAKRLITKNENFNYVFFANKNKNKLSDYDVNMKDPDFIISCDVFGLIPAEVINEWNMLSHINAQFIDNSETHLKKQSITF